MERGPRTNRRVIAAVLLPQMREDFCGDAGDRPRGGRPEERSVFFADTPPVLRRGAAYRVRPIVVGRWCRLRRREWSAAHRRGTRREAATPTRRSRQIGTVLSRWRVVTVWGSRAIASRRCALIVASVLAPPSPRRVGFHPPALPPTVPSGAADSSASVLAVTRDSLRSTRCHHRSVT